jgi:hypothetical protein
MAQIIGPPVLDRITFFHIRHVAKGEPKLRDLAFAAHYDMAVALPVGCSKIDDALRTGLE